MDPGKHNETSTLTYMGTCTQHKSYQIQKSRTTQGKTRLKTPFMIKKFLWVCHSFVGMSHFHGYVKLSWVCHTFVGMSHFCEYVTILWVMSNMIWSIKLRIESRFNCVIAVQKKLSS